MTAIQPRLFDVSSLHRNSTSFIDNMRLPVHGWFRFSAGFSAQWVESLLREAEDARVLDPFAGSATTLIAAQASGHASMGVDPHPFISRVALAKLSWSADVYDFETLAAKVAANATPARLPSPCPPLLEKCFPANVLEELLGYRDAVKSVCDKVGEEHARLLWLTFVATIRAVSPVGTAQWQYVLPNRTKLGALAPSEAWRLQAQRMASDMRLMQARMPTPVAAHYNVADARSLSALVPAGWATHVICSPPYTNNYDYADATRLEQTVLGEVYGWGDLRSVRDQLIRACSQHMTSAFDWECALGDSLLKPISDELTEVFERLRETREHYGGRKAYHTMVVAYFHDLARVWQELRKVTAAGASVSFVVGDSAPYGVYVPVDKWLGVLAEAAGFRNPRFEKVRDRNTRWRNRKHRVPLHEGVLRVNG